MTGPQGVGELTRDALGQMVVSDQYTLHDFRIEDVKMRQVSDDVAVLAYKVHEELSVNGDRVSFDAADASTWVRQDGSWVCALHTEALTGDPFGRDRQATAASR